MNLVHIPRIDFEIVPSMEAEPTHVIKWSKDMVRHFFRAMADPENTWLQKCKNKPKYDDIMFVYVIYSGRVRYRLNYVHHESGATRINVPGCGGSFSNWEYINWPRVVMTGPIVIAPRPIKIKGFQGFRYCTELF